MTWTMRDGTVIAIKDMETSHIINSIKMLERNKANIRQRKIRSTFAFEVGGEMASLAQDEYLMELMEMSDDECLEQYTSYLQLKKELERRS